MLRMLLMLLLVTVQQTTQFVDMYVHLVDMYIYILTQVQLVRLMMWQPVRLMLRQLVQV